MPETRRLPVHPALAAAAPAQSRYGRQTASGAAPSIVKALGRLPYWSLAGIIVGFGAVLRIRQWTFGRSFWSDELYVAHNLRERSYLELLEPLAFSQSAPPGWLWLERLSLQLFGPTEQSMRLVPLLFGLALLPLVGWLGRRLMPPLTALTALLLVAIAPFLIAYSNELKPYSAEAFCVTLLVGTALLLTRRNRLTRRSGIEFWGIALVTSVLSIMAIPVAAALGVLIGLHTLVSPGQRWVQRLRELGRFLLPAPIWIIAALWIYVAVLAPGQNDAHLQAYWLGKAIYPYQPLTNVPATLDWLDSTYRSLARVPFVSWSAWIVVPLLVTGAVLWWRRVAALAVLILVTPLMVGLVGAAASVYPFTGRLALYTVPALLMLASLAVAAPDARHGVPSRVRRALGAALVIALAAPQLALDVTASTRPQHAFPQGGGANVADYRTALRHLSDERRPDDLFLATRLSWNSQSYYGPPADGYVAPAPPTGCPQRTVAELLAGRSRVWLFQITDWEEIENRDVIVRLGSRGGAVTERIFRGARLVRIDLPADVTVGADVCLVAPPDGAAVR
ncbi:glycosyltransferase family 39 protein [Verrucosispora sp. WMMA2044]|uniref:glycosyltransferase family 39 protein n=1 Tax=Verrucosispora sp. WMMA2044 TaxID=3016419 RepID=UPI00248B71CB|nr:glycosyltransferase family 39 protein [Verrucosispora sp. WMMA2044]WBB47355.1 glycosyltransferase family 39 protein [Verrucosispora sp. WMMA2044]